MKQDTNFTVLVKKGDDIRKDQLIVGILRILGVLLEEKGLVNYLQYYTCLPTGPDEGLIEIVQNSITIGDIYNDQNNLSKTLLQGNTEKHSLQNKVNTAKRVLLHRFAIQEYLITRSTLSNRSLRLQREKMNDYARLKVPRILKVHSTSTMTGNSIEEIDHRFAGSLGQYHLR